MANLLAGYKPGFAIPSSDDPNELRLDAEARREDLIANLAALKRTVTDKFDVQKQAQHFVQLGKQRAEHAIDLARERARERPGLLIGVVVGVAALIAVGLTIYQRSRPPRWQRQLEAYRRALSENVYIRIGRREAGRPE